MDRTIRLAIQTAIGLGIVGVWLWLGSLLFDTFDLIEALGTALIYFAFFEAGVLSRYAAVWFTPKGSYKRKRTQ